MSFKFLFVLLYLSTTLFSDFGPWGIDADLASEKKPIEQPQKITPVNRVGIHLIHFYQNVISPANGPKSHYAPSSSLYTLRAMQKYGFIKGWIMGCDRLMRENDEEWFYLTIPVGKSHKMKWDPP